MAAVASLPALRVGALCRNCTRLAHISQGPTSPVFNAASIIQNHRFRALNGVPRASSTESPPENAEAVATRALKESEEEIFARRMATLFKEDERQQSISRKMSLFEAESKLRSLEAQMKVSVPFGLVTAAAYYIKYQVFDTSTAGTLVSEQSTIDLTFLGFLFLAALYLKPFILYPPAKTNWDRLNKIVEEDRKRESQEGAK